MKPVDSFFSALHGAFRPDDDTGTLFLIVAAVLLVTAVAALMVRRRRRIRAPLDELRRLIADRRLRTGDVQTLEALALATAEDALALAARLEVFERATAVVFAHQPATLVVREHDIFDRTHKLRRALGFANLPDHFPLLTTRELAVGAHVDLGGLPLVVAEVNEAFWTARAPTAPRVAAGTWLPAVVIRAQDARYDLTVRLLASAAAEEGRTLQLSHDEAPRRAQHRDFVRVNAHGPVRVRPVPARIGPRPASLDEMTGQLVDISLGGMALHVPARLPPGVDVIINFSFAEDFYKDIAALVLDCQPQASGGPLLRLSFRKIAAEDEQRLAAAINAVTARPVLSGS